MDKLQVINYVSIALSDINFMIVMLIIVMIAAVFLGRYIVISKKMIIATCGIVLVQLLVIIGGGIIIEHLFPEMAQTFEDYTMADAISKENPYYDTYIKLSFVASNVLNLLVFVYAFVFYLIANKEKKLLRAIESTVCLYLYYAYINTIGQYSYIYLNGGNSELANNVFVINSGKDSLFFTLYLELSTFVTSLAILLLIYFIYYKKHRVFVIRIRDRILFVVWFLIFSTFPVFPIVKENVQEQYEILSIIFGVLIPILGTIAPLVLLMGAAEKNLKEKNKYQEEYLTAELDYIERYKHSQEETRAFRHDIINNLSLTSMLLEDGKVEEAGQHLKDLLGNVKALSPSIITGDEMLDCIVAMKSDKMKEKGIDFDIDGVIDGGLHMKPTDICSIFANSLDNAIEAASKYSPADGEDNPWVKMNIKRTEKFFVINVTNCAVDKVDVEKLFMSSGYTSKKDKEHHGFGLRNIRNCVEEYDGIIKASSDENSFSLSIMIPRN
ncbi:MAG: GHKL domain-containing protein [Eubacterium sp.]|nr:GHKL domain-containing protein [Eubacterium sp.]